MLPYFETEFTKHGRKPLKLDIGQLIGGSLNTTHTQKKVGGDTTIYIGITSTRNWKIEGWGPLRVQGDSQK